MPSTVGAYEQSYVYYRHDLPAQWLHFSVPMFAVIVIILTCLQDDRCYAFVTVCDMLYDRPTLIHIHSQPLCLQPEPGTQKLPCLCAVPRSAAVPFIIERHKLSLRSL